MPGQAMKDPIIMLLLVRIAVWTDSTEWTHAGLGLSVCLRGKPFICRFTYALARTSLNFEVILTRTKANAAAAVAI